MRLYISCIPISIGSYEHITSCKYTRLKMLKETIQMKTLLKYMY